MSDIDLLRRLVLEHRDGYNYAVADVLRAMGHTRIAWAHIEGATLSVYCYDRKTARALACEIGGDAGKQSNERGERWHQWSWNAVGER